MENLEKLVQVVWVYYFSSRAVEVALCLLLESLISLLQEETWDIEEGSQNNVLTSSMQVSNWMYIMLFHHFASAKYVSRALCSLLILDR